MKFTERLNMDAVRQICIEKRLCTRMDSAEYSNMLSIANREINSHTELAASIEEMASLIYSGSAESEYTVENVASAIFIYCVDRWAE